MLDFRLNPDEPASNMLAFPVSASGCCPGGGVEKLYTAAFAYPVTSITVEYEGEPLVVEFDKPITTTEGWYTQLCEALAKSQKDGGAGILDFDNGNRGVEVDGPNVTLCSAAPFLSFEGPDGPVEFTCTEKGAEAPVEKEK